MLRYLIVFIEILILVLVLRTSYAQNVLLSTQVSFTSWLSGVTETVDKLAMSELHSALAAVMKNMRPYEIEYIDGLLSDKARLAAFHSMYCIQGDKNPYVYGDNLVEMCHKIKLSGILEQKI